MTIDSIRYSSAKCFSMKWVLIITATIHKMQSQKLSYLMKTEAGIRLRIDE